MVTYTIQCEKVGDGTACGVHIEGELPGPPIWAQCTEPISATTVTAETLFVVNDEGRRLDTEVECDAVNRQPRLQLTESLERAETHTATVTTGVRDTSGNALAPDYAWSFSMEEGSRLYLPVVLKR